MRLVATPPGARGQALRHAARHGWAWAELPARLATDDDPAMVETIVGLVALLLGSGADLTCERHGARRITPPRIAVGAARNLQVTRLRSALERVGLREVVVGTANRLQGLEFDVTVVWHPLSGRASVDEFYGEAGRMSVLCSRTVMRASSSGAQEWRRRSRRRSRCSSRASARAATPRSTAGPPTWSWLAGWIPTGSRCRAGRTFGTVWDT